MAATILVEISDEEAVLLEAEARSRGTTMEALAKAAVVEFIQQLSKQKLK